MTNKRTKKTKDALEILENAEHKFNNSDPVSLAFDYFKQGGTTDGIAAIIPDYKSRLYKRLMAIAGEPVEMDGRSCFGIYYYDSEAKAMIAGIAIRLRGDTYNGGFFHGMACGLDSSFDVVRNGVKWYAVTTS